ncbi:MAG TPA: DUF1801 domain-containing protein [Bryobacteraceae bacterium]|nr:DUF1801 domain-containing protein [Bryobacteraceae bacterium]
MKLESPQARLKGFLAKFTPEIEKTASAILRAMRAHVPGATELVYDNYNALAIGFAASERSRDVVFSIAVFPRWVSLFFFNGPSLPDPQKLLRGSGHVVRHIVLQDAADLDKPAIRELMKEGLRRADAPIDPKAKRRLIIKSVSAKQRPRRPASAARNKQRAL